MITALDTDVLVHWAMDGAPHHRAVRRFIELELGKRGNRMALTPQVLHEFLHVVTDARRFDVPLQMRGAIDLARALWDGKETVRLLPAPVVFHRTIELLETLELGRRRILGTALAATCEAAGVKRLATFNSPDFRVFSFVEAIDPARRHSPSPRRPAQPASGSAS